MALLGSGCVRCGQPYAPRGIRVLAQREEIAFVQLVCFACQIQTLALVTGVDAVGDDDEPAGDEPAAGRGNGPARRASAPVISEDDVIEMRAFLDGYEGDIRGLMSGSTDPGLDDGGSDERGRPR